MSSNIALFRYISLCNFILVSIDFKNSRISSANDSVEPVKMNYYSHASTLFFSLNFITKRALIEFNLVYM